MNPYTNGPVTHVPRKSTVMNVIKPVSKAAASTAMSFFTLIVTFIMLLVILMFVVMSLAAEAYSQDRPLYAEGVQAVAFALGQNPEDKRPKAAITDMAGLPVPFVYSKGGVLILSATKAIHGDDNESIQWIVMPADLSERMQQFWDRERGPLLVVPIGDEPPDEITVVQVVSLNNIGSKASVTLRLDKPNPKPKPKPVDPVDPVDPVPQPIKFKDAVKTLVNKYNLPANEKPFVAAAFREVANGIDNGSIGDMPLVLKKTMDSIGYKIGLNATLNWIKWRDDVTKALEAENVKTVKEHAAYWRTIADAVEGK